MKAWNFYTTNEIKPQGWLKRQLEIQANGLSGHLDKIWPDVRDSAWIGGKREGWERVPYWLDGFIPLAYLLQNEDMIARAKKYVDAILAAQKADGWICPCADDQRETYDTWAIQLITKVLVGYYECSRDARIPEVVYRTFKNYYELLKSGKISLFAWGKARWFEAFIGLNFLQSHYQEEWILELAKLLKAQGTNYSEFSHLWKRPLNKWTFETHIVNVCMMLKAEAVSCDLLGEKYCDTAEQLRSILAQYNGTPCESFTGDECLSGLSPIQGTELCSIVELMYSYELLYAYTGDKKWAEKLEVLAFNALPGTMSDDMWTHQYDQLSNQMACKKFPVPGKVLFRTNGADAHLFGLEPHFGCCTSNFNQGWPKFTLSAFLHRENTVLSATFLPTELKTKDFTVTLNTNYPFENSAVYTVSAQKPFTLAVRVPSFAKNLTVNGEAKESELLQFNIQPGETKIALAFETEAYFKKRPHGLNTVQCGSLIFGIPVQYEKTKLEYEENGVERKFPYCDYELTPTSTWNYAYASQNLTVERHEVNAVPFSSENPAVTVTATVREIEWGLEDGFEYVCAKVPESTEPISEARQIKLYPYGCAKLRMTELPLQNKS